MAEGGFAAAVGAFLACALLIVAAGLWRPFARAVSAIPISLSSAMLAGVLLDLCLAPVHAVRDIDRKSVVEGKSVSVRVDLGGRRIIKKKKRNTSELERN